MTNFKVYNTRKENNMYNIVIKNLITGEYDTPDTSDLLHKGDVISVNGEKWVVIGGKVLPTRE